MNSENNAKIPISVAIITRNEETKLPDCLKSVSFAGDVVVVDSESTDRTVEIAEALGARIFIEPWRDFSYQKQFAVDRCRYDWVLILDADERIPEETAGHIARIIRQSDSSASGFSFRRKNYFHGRWIKHCGWWPNPVLRLVDRRKGAFDGRTVHESWVTEGPVKALDDIIVHLSFRDYSELIVKLEQYTTIGARDLYDRNEKPGAFKSISHGIWMFLTIYILKQGFREGFDGFVIALMHGAGSFFKYAKHLEMTKHPDVLHHSEKIRSNDSSVPGARSGQGRQEP